MGNDLVGQAFDAMEKFRPDKTIIKIWNLNNLCIILAVKDPEQYETEMDPYYAFANGKVEGISFIDNEAVLSKVMKPQNLIYHLK